MSKTKGNKKVRPASSFVPLVPERILSRHRGSDGWIKHTNEHIARFNRLAQTMPLTYGWRFRTLEAFKAEMEELFRARIGVGEINRLYWTDTLKNCEAYTVMSIWRMVELARGTVRSLANRETIGAAILARAAMESVVQYLDTARTIAGTLDQLHSVNFSRDQVISTEIEELILKTVFSSRLPDVEDYRRPTNILTMLNRVGKLQGQSGIVQTYSQLCEVAHPNLLGRSVYLVAVRPGPRDGDEIREISLAQGPTSSSIDGATIWALSWAMAAQVSSTELMQASIASLYAKLPQRNV